MLVGFATVPLGCLAGGFVMKASGFELTVRDIIMNTIPVVVVAVLIILGLVLAQEKMLKGFIAFGKGVTAVVTAGTVIAVAQYLTGIRLPLFHVMVEANAEGIVPLEDGFLVIGEIAIVLLGFQIWIFVDFFTTKLQTGLRMSSVYTLSFGAIFPLIAAILLAVAVKYAADEGTAQRIATAFEKRAGKTKA